LQNLLGYPAYNSGLALSPRGIGALTFTPITGYLTSRIDPRKLLLVAFVIGAFSMFSLSGLNLNAGYWDIFWPQVLQGIAMSFLFIPLSALAVAEISPQKMGNATSIFNLMRNIGGSVGIALMTTLVARRTQFHQNRLVEKITSGNASALAMRQQFQGFFHSRGADSYMASRQALAAIYGMVQSQASMLAFVESFWVMAILFLSMVPFVFLLRYNRHEPLPKARTAAAAPPTKDPALIHG
jgi:DHA2 family multidrug resistance protein